MHNLELLRVKLLNTNSFLSKISQVYMPLIDKTAPTSYTDGKSIYMVEKQLNNIDEAVWIYAHELAHIMLHFKPRAVRKLAIAQLKKYTDSPELYAKQVEMICCELEANILANKLTNNSVIGKLPEQVEKFHNKFRVPLKIDVTAEELVSKVIKYFVDKTNRLHTKLLEKMFNLINNKTIEILDKLSPEEKNKINENFKLKCKIANVENIKAGDIPGRIRDILEIKYNTIVDWRILLNKYFKHSLVKYSYTIPDYKRPYIYSPGVIRKKEQITIAIAIDFSGSISKSVATKFLGNVKSLLSTTDVDLNNSIVIPFDSEVKKGYVMNLDKFSKLDNFDIIAFGGTDYRPIFKYVDDYNKSKSISTLLIFTDGEPITWQIRKPVGYDTIWVVTDAYSSNVKDKIPFGQLCNFDLKGD
ncbi:MAG: VWA-like domain-containing protein [Thermoplasmata archaeon]